MATLKVKARPKPANGQAAQSCAPLPGDRPAQQKGAVQKAGDAIPTSCASLREYLKTNH
jgi:hypothetical protein